ncbi:MAG TPA: alpha/beta hydrolase [Methanoregula sp.]|nr:alpha/beta hydrolase [Methanoregula sp.]
MKNLRTYGNAPYTVAVIHGGPGAAGEMAPVACELSLTLGVLEPLQTERTLSGQVAELKNVLAGQGDLPVILIGHSWGAMLGFIFTAKNPFMVKKLILVSSGVFDDRYAAGIMSTRSARLSHKDTIAIDSLVTKLNDPESHNKDRIFAELGTIIEKADSFDALDHSREGIKYNYDIYTHVWAEAEALRKSGALIEPGTQIRCPVVAIHGDYDPHPADGVKIPLSRVIKNFKFFLLENCGHYPWRERSARDRFYEILHKELDAEPGR